MINPHYHQLELDAEQADRDRQISDRIRYGVDSTPCEPYVLLGPIEQPHGPHDWERYPWVLESGVWRASVGRLVCEVRGQRRHEPDGLRSAVFENGEMRKDWQLYRYGIELKFNSPVWNTWQAWLYAIARAESVRRWDDRQV